MRLWIQGAAEKQRWGRSKPRVGPRRRKGGPTAGLKDETPLEFFGSIQSAFGDFAAIGVAGSSEKGMVFAGYHGKNDLS